jgi:hypothetical protein
LAYELHPYRKACDEGCCIVAHDPELSPSIDLRLDSYIGPMFSIVGDGHTFAADSTYEDEVCDPIEDIYGVEVFPAIGVERRFGGICGPHEMASAGGVPTRQG